MDALCPHRSAGSMTGRVSQGPFLPLYFQLQTPGGGVPGESGLQEAGSPGFCDEVTGP